MIVAECDEGYVPTGKMNCEDIIASEDCELSCVSRRLVASGGLSDVTIVCAFVSALNSPLGVLVIPKLLFSASSSTSLFKGSKYANIINTLNIIASLVRLLRILRPKKVSLLSSAVIYAPTDVFTSNF
jgi:hypothetical protein